MSYNVVYMMRTQKEGAWAIPGLSGKEVATIWHQRTGGFRPNI